MAETGDAGQREDALRSAGLRAVRVWLPDTRTEAFAAECRRQSRLIRDAETADSAEEEAWFEASDKSGWTA